MWISIWRRAPRKNVFVEDMFWAKLKSGFLLRLTPVLQALCCYCHVKLLETYNPTIKYDLANFAAGLLQG